MHPSQLPLSQLKPGKNPRRYFDAASMEELESSIRAQGVIQAILVRPLDDGYEVVAGGRRFAAAKKVFGDDYEIPVLVKEMTDEEAEKAALNENVVRANMSAAEEAEAAAKVLARCNGDRDEAARRLGWTRTVLDRRLALMNCTQAVRDALIEQKILIGHAELIATLAKDKQDAVLGQLLKAPSVPTVNDLKAQIQALANALSTAIFDKSDCAGCPHNSSEQQALFSETVSEGHCTNRSCWNEKTEAELGGRVEKMKDEFPEVRIVRPGEDFTVIKLVPEGAHGVGAEQAALCRSCKSFGAAISAVPGKVGNTYKDLCFDSECNAKKVKANQDAILAAAAPQKESAQKQGASTSSGSAAQKSTQPKAPKPASSVQDSQRVKDYREKVWRRALQKHLATHKEQSAVVLLALCLSGSARHINDGKLREVFEALTQSKIDTLATPATVAATLQQVDETVQAKMHVALAASAAEGLEIEKVVGLLKELKVELSAHWTLDAEYLNLLTKSEIEVVADQIGLKGHLDKEYQKLMAGKKDEIIKKFLEVENFDLAGKIPVNMQFAK